MRSVTASSARLLDTVPGSPTRIAANSNTNGKYLFTTRDIPGVGYRRPALRRRARRVTALNTF